MEAPPGPASPTLTGAVLAGALLATLLEAALMLAAATARAAHAAHGPALAFSRFAFSGGWFVFPVLGAAAGAALAGWRRRGAAAARAWGLAVALAALGAFGRPALDTPLRPGPRPSPRQRVIQIARWTFQSPAEVESVLALAHDPSPIVREQVMLALGENIVVEDVEHATPGRPPRWPRHPLRARMRAELLAAMAGDSSEGVRAEAARALWNAPRVYGSPRAAADTLAAVLDRATRPGALERLAWLALDAAAGPPDSTLRRAAARFADATPDTELARVARLVASRRPAP